MDAQALGRYLRETREAKELTLDEAERALRIRRRILESFEVGEFIFPDFAAIQIRGFMRNYARYLGLEEDRIVGYYEAALLESTHPKRLSGRKPSSKRKDKHDTQPLTPVAPRKITDTPPSLPAVVIPPSGEAQRARPGIITVLLRLLVAVAALAVIAYVVIQLIQTNNSPTTVPDGGGILGQLPPSPTITLQPTTDTSIALLPTSAPNLQPNFTGQGVLVTINTTERTWLKVTADNTAQYEGTARPGTSLQYPAGDNVTVVASNAQALNVVYNGQQQSTFGARGQMVTIIFGKSGVQISSGPGYAPTPVQSDTPQPTPTNPNGALVAQLTPSETPGPSPTPTVPPTVTPIPSATPVPSNTLVPSSTPIPSDTLVPSNTPTQTLTPTNTTIPTNTPTATLTPTFTLTPSNTPVPSNTPIPPITPSPTATSILPPRAVPPGATATKAIG